mgnify:CR=1 FL=1|jgi:DNA-directed RNA polymerase specialized sigma24 family protein
MRKTSPSHCSASERARALRETVEELPRSERLLLLLCYADDLTPREISMIVDKPVREVEHTLVRLTALLRERLRREAMPRTAS